MDIGTSQCRRSRCILVGSTHAFGDYQNHLISTHPNSGSSRTAGYYYYYYYETNISTLKAQGGGSSNSRFGNNSNNNKHRNVRTSS